MRDSYWRRVEVVEKAIERREFEETVEIEMLVREFRVQDLIVRKEIRGTKRESEQSRYS